MTAPEIREDELQAFVDGKLSGSRCTAVLAHLGRHPKEIERLAQYALHKDEIRRSLHALLPPEENPATVQLQCALAEQLTRPIYGRWLRHAASIGLLIALGWSSHALYHSYLEPHLPSVVIEAARAHETFGEDTERPVELAAASRAEMAAWFSRHLGEPVEIPSLRTLGLHLIGGRMLTGDQGPVAQLIYEDAAGRRLTLCLSAGPGDLGSEVELVEVDGLTAGYWREGDLSYALVAETSDLQLVAIASELGAAAPADLL